MTVKVFWQPQSFNLDQIGQKRLVDISDGDTPNIRMNVRMLSIDTPETSTMQLKKAEMASHFSALADWIESGKSPVGDALAAHLLPASSEPMDKTRSRCTSHKASRPCRRLSP